MSRTDGMILSILRYAQAMRLAIDTPLRTILQILSIMPFEQVRLYDAPTAAGPDAGPEQLPLFAS